MKLFDLRLRGSLFTLGQVVNETDHSNFRELISYWQGSKTDTNSEVPSNFKLVPKDGFSIEKCEKISKWLLQEEYATQEGEEYVLTKKTLDVFEKSIKIDKELSEKGFTCCPCSDF